MPSRKAWLGVAAALLWACLPEWPRIPVEGASPRDWNAQTFWYEPWGRSGVHKGIDIFAKPGTAVRAASYGVVLYRGEIERGGKVIVVLGPKWRIHYYAHLQAYDVYPGQPLLGGTYLGRVGDSGNARGKPAHLHYSVVSLLPLPWRMDDTTQGWKKMFYLDPNQILSRAER
ncbi:M23 family metallopeptidase [Pseudomonas sp. MBLB4123]|uniref:M23 family metallopeptidase n=1 Tax=Pseudomonas sp. MBLB4123 TaxID=3451557 RepID=UPI003F74E133